MDADKFTVEELKNIEEMNKHLIDERSKGGTGRPFNGPVDDVVGSGLDENMANEIKARQNAYAATGAVSEGSLDSVASSSGVAHMESTIQHMQTQRAKEGYVDPRSIDAIVGAGGAEGMENEIKTRQNQNAVSGHIHEGSLDNVAGSDAAESVAAEIRTRQYQNAARGAVNEGSLDNVAASDNVEQVEATIRHMVAERAQKGAINEGSADNAAVSGNYDKNARVREIIESADARTYFPQLLSDPTKFDPAKFKTAVTGGIRSNEALENFFNGYIENLSTAITLSKTGQPKEDGQVIANPKQTIEGYLNVYSNLIYELKVQDAVVNFDKLKFPDEIKEDLLSAQKSLCEPGEVFAMPIPARTPGNEPMEVLGDAASVINHINGYTPQGFIGRVIGPNPNYVPVQDATVITEMGPQ